VDWTGTVFELIDTRSFSDLWYWIALAVVWSRASHYVIGVPYDMVTRAAREGGQAQADLEDIVRIRGARHLRIVEAAGPWLVALVALALSVLLLLGFFYGVEFAQAMALIALPLTAVGWVSVATARAAAQGPLTGEALRRRMTRHRATVQVIGMVSVFVTALWGMYRNLDAGPWG